MSTHFSRKSLSFYGVIIVGVIVLFRIVSWYGETYLTAPANIAGEYLSEQSLPGCPPSLRLALTIQQSGIYLHGALQLIEAAQETSTQSTSPATKPDLTLRGALEQQQISLTGSALLPATCQIPGNPAAPIPIAIQGTVSDPEQAKFSGDIRLGSGTPLAFTAVRQPADAPTSNPH